MDENKKISEGELGEVSGGVPDKSYSGGCYIEVADLVSLKKISSGSLGVLCSASCLKIDTWCSCYDSPWRCENKYHVLDKVEADGFASPAPKNDRGHNYTWRRVYVGKQ